MNQHVALKAALPEGLQKYAGELLDVDSHEMMPAQVWVEHCGEVCEPLAHEWLNNGEDVSSNPNHSNCPGYAGDVAPIEKDTIWQRKGSLAPGAVDITRREAVMDLMGVKRQLCFPTGVGMWGTFLVMFPEDPQAMPTIGGDRIAYGKALCRAYAEWAIGANRVSDRVRFVLPVFGDSVDELMTTAEYLIRGGIRSFWLPSSMLPGGKSPAHSDLDPFWKLLTDNGVTACLHTGPDQAYKSREWGNAEVFEGFRLLSEFRCDPWTLSHNHTTARNFTATMVVGGVFERHPDLRFGVIEIGSFWVGPLCESLDMWYDVGKGFATDKTYRLPKAPSTYIKRNVRVSCFDFEPIDTFITRYGLEDVLCFASDYPHVEGGKNPAGVWYDRLKPLGDEVVEKFYVRNARWLLPD